MPYNEQPETNLEQNWVESKFNMFLIILMVELVISNSHVENWYPKYLSFSFGANYCFWCAQDKWNYEIGNHRKTTKILKIHKHKSMLIIINMINYTRIKEGKLLYNMLTVLQNWGWTRKCYIVFVLIPCTSNSMELFFNESISEFGSEAIILTFLWEFFCRLFDAM